MFDKDFIRHLEEALQNEKFIRMLIEREKISSDHKMQLIAKSINFLVSTRDFDGFSYYLDHYYKFFPHDYLKDKGMSKEESESIIYDNFIRNGFLYHTTPSYNVNEIMTDGLQTLNDRCGIDVYQKSIEVNEVYRRIRDRNKGIFPISSLITIPGYTELDEERFNSVYLSSNLEYTLQTYGLSSELSNQFVRDFFWAFKSDRNHEKMNKPEIREEIIYMLESSKAIIHDEEIDSIIGFFDKVYRERDKCDNYGQAILMIPTKAINPEDKKFNMLYRDNRLNLPVETIIDLNKGEVVNYGSISPENIIAITPTIEKVLTLRTNKR